MPDKIFDWIKRELSHISGYIEAVDRRCSECRAHCDQARKACGTRSEDYEYRIRALEMQTVATAKGSRLIATCAIVSGLMGVAGNLIARLF